MEKLNWSELSRAMAQSYDPAAHARLLVDSYNASTGDLPHLDCPKCRNKGVIAHVRGDNSRYFVPCACMKTRDAIARMERSGLKNSIRELTFEKFEARENWQKQLKAGTMAYAGNPEGWLILCGQSGCGKTHLCTAICRERLLRGEDVHYMSWREDITRLKALRGDDPEREALLHRLKTAGLLYIDDLFKSGSPDGSLAKPTAADINLAFEILNHRYCARLKTIFSTQLQIHELIDIDEATCGRIVELCGQHVYAVREMRERNYRLRNLMRL